MVERNGTVTVRMPLAEWSAACDEAALPEPPPLAPAPIRH